MLKDYFTFTRNQGRAIITLLFAITLCLLFYFLIPVLFAGAAEKPDTELQKMMALIIPYEKNTSYGNSTKQEVSHNLTPLNFDPNTLDSAGFAKMGLREKLIRTLLNYRNKGGRFYNKESLKRIYGLHPDEYLQLEPFIAIAGQTTYQQKESVIVELNSADTTLLVKLRGIGSKLSMNIVQYREKLGGFVSSQQLKEVYGISEKTYAEIKASLRVNPALIRKINLNEATLYEMNAHPYLKGEIAKAIADFRKQKNYHLEDIKQLKEIELINEEIFRKIAPYIKIQ